ncbi:MAG: Ig-like domain-containing protein, partial [Acinetobacter sp.]
MAIIQSNSFKAGTKVTIYLLKADGSIDGSIVPIVVTVLANGTFARNVPFNNGENFLLVGTDKQGLAYSTNFTVADTTRPDKPLFSAQDDIGVVQGAIQPNTTTDDNQPTFSGTSKEVGGVVKVFDQGVEIGSATVKPDGTWSFTPTTPLADGNHVITIQQVDPKGNISALSDPLTFAVDTQPVKVEILKALDDFGLNQSDLANHAITDDATPTLVGTGLANAVVHISENGTELGSTTVDATGNWTFELPTQIDGTHQYTATIINTAGVSGSTQFTLTIDTAAPTTTATLTGITDDSGTVGDYITNDPSLILNGTITGTVEPTDKVQVSVDGGATWQEATIDSATATWTLDHTAQPLTNGQHEVVVRVIDEAGNIGPLSTPQTIIIDTEIPTAQANITGITEDTGVASDFMTADTTLAIHGEITGTLAVDEKVQVRIDSGSWVEATLDRVSNTWTLDNTATPLAEGAHQVETRIIDAAANATTPVAKQIVIDTTASLAIAQISAITTDTGTAGDYITNDNTLLISGRILNTLAANDTVQVSLDNGVTWTNAVVDPVTHTWSLDNTGHPLVDGTYNVQARVIDVVGNTGIISSQTVVIDTQASSVVSTLTAITEDTGMVGDFSTNDNSLELTGSLSAPLAAGDQVQISLNGGKTWLEATVDPATNTWSYDNTDNPLADGIYKFQTRVIDQAGNVGQVTAQDIVIDTRAPLTSAVFTGITEDTGTTGDYITNDNALVFKGKINGGALAAGDTVQLSLDGGVTWVEATVNPATRTWSYDNTANPLADGTHTLIARVVDKAGNPGFETTQEIQIDTAASTASSSLTSITTDTGVLGDYITSDNSLVFKGKVEGVLAADERVQISLDGGATWLESTLDRATNVWNYNNTINELADGSYTVQSRVIDTAGNAGAVSTQTMVIDSSIPTATATLTTISDDTGTAGDFITQDSSLLFQGNVTGVLATNENVQISFDGGRNWVEVTLDRTANTWQFDHTNNPLAEGTYNVQVRVIDTANNVGQLTSQNVVINSQPSAASVEFTGITEDSGIAGDHITNDNSLVLHGKILNNLAATDLIEISLDNGTTWQGTVVDRTNHTWSYDNTANPLADGAYTFQARVVDVAGVAGTASTVNVQIDTQAPDSTTLAKLSTITDDTGVIDDFVTSDNTLLLNGEITGQLDATDKVSISLNGGKTWSEATVDYTNKTWSFDNTDNPLADGTYKVQVRVIDLAGNQGDISEQDVVIDSRPPVASALFSNITEDTGVVGDYQTKDNSLVFNGTIIGDVAANDAVEVSLDGGTTWIKAVLDPVAKTWTLDHSATTLGDGTYTLAARVVDQAGNTGPLSTQKLVIDTSAPTATSEFTSITEDTGTAGDYQTNDQTLMISGKVTGILATDDQVQLSLDGGQTWLNVTVDSATNTWTYNNTANTLAEGTYQFQTRVVDKVLNGDVTDTQEVVIDLTPPPASLTLAFTGISDDTGIAGDYKTSDTTLIINGKIESGTLTANDHIEVSVDGGNTWITAQIDPVSHTWSLDNTANTLSSGTHQFIARVVDQVGNIGHQVTQDVTIVTEPPKATADLTLITDDSGVAGDFVTNDPSLIYSGNVTGVLDPDETVQVSLDGGLNWLTATIDPTGTSWSLDHSAINLVDGQYTVITRVIDSTGTAGTESTKEITIDTTVPTATTTLSSISQDSGQAGDFITNDNTLIFNGTVVGNLAADERVQISLDGGATWTDAALDRPANMWILDNTAATLADGTYTVVSRVIDQAGNIGASSTPQNVIIDTALPSSLASITSISEDTGVNTSDFVTKDATLIIHGKASTALASNEKVQVSFDNGASWVDATSKADGTWSYDNTAQTLQDGTYTVQARVIDTAGNSSTVATQSFTVDTKVPTALSDLDLKDDVGAIKGTIPEQGVTDDTRPEFTGKAPADAAYVNIYDNGNLMGTATVQADGTWSFTPTLPLGAGP